MYFALAALALTACGTKKSDTAAASDTATPTADEYVYYEGVLPAADADGVRYSLTLDYDDDNPDKGDYKLTETYIKGDSAVSSFLTEGDFDVKTGTPTDPSARYLVMVPEVEAGETPGQSMYFIAETDSTLTLVSADLTKAVNPEMNYTITRVAQLQK